MESLQGELDMGCDLTHGDAIYFRNLPVSLLINSTSEEYLSRYFRHAFQAVVDYRTELVSKKAFRIQAFQRVDLISLHPVAGLIDVLLDSCPIVLDLQMVQTAMYYRLERVRFIILGLEFSPFFPHPDKTFIDNVFCGTIVMDIGIGYFDKHLPASGEYPPEFFFCQVSGAFFFFCHTCGPKVIQLTACFQDVGLSLG